MRKTPAVGSRDPVGSGLPASRVAPLIVGFVAMLLAAVFEAAAACVVWFETPAGFRVRDSWSETWIHGHAGVFIGGDPAGVLTVPAESWFRTWTWQYSFDEVAADGSAGLVRYTSTPLLVIFALVVGALVLQNCVRWAGPSTSPWWLRARLLIGLVAAGVVVGLAASAPTEPGFTAAWGPTVALVAGGVGAAGVLFARPWSAATRPVVVPEEGSGGPEPAPSPPDWYPDPAHRHELRYWDGTGWTSHVGDAGALSEDPQPLGAPSEDTAAP